MNIKYEESKNTEITTKIQQLTAQPYLLLKMLVNLTYNFQLLFLFQVGMGIIPLQYKTGDTAESLGLNGTEQFSVNLPEDLKPRQNINVVNESTGTSFEVICRFDTELELTYNKHGGILNYMIRKVVS